MLCHFMLLFMFCCVLILKELLAPLRMFGDLAEFLKSLEERLVRCFTSQLDLIASSQDIFTNDYASCCAKSHPSNFITVIYEVSSSIAITF